jgi:hypothetical protein
LAAGLKPGDAAAVPDDVAQHRPKGTEPVADGDVDGPHRAQPLGQRARRGDMSLADASREHEDPEPPLLDGQRHGAMIVPGA